MRMKLFGGILAATVFCMPTDAQTPTTDGVEFVINTPTNGTQGSPSIASFDDGSFVAVWFDYSQTAPDTSFSAIRAQLFDAAGAPAGGSFLVNSVTTGTQENPSVAVLAGGGFVIVWDDQSGTAPDTSGKAVRAQLYDAAGATVGAEFVVNTFTTGSQYEPDVAALENGGFVISWTDGSGAGTDVSGTAIRARLYNSVGVAAGVEFQVNTTTSSFQSQPEVAALPGSDFVVTWSDNSQAAPDTDLQSVRAQRFDASGAALGGEFTVNTTTADQQWRQSVAALDGGGFVVTWADSSATGGDTSAQAIRAQRYDAAGVAAGGEFLVNTTTTAAQNTPSVASLTDGGFMIAWADSSATGADTSDAAVRAQRFDAVGDPVGDEFLVNTTTANVQNLPDLVELVDGTVLVAWFDFSQTAPDTNLGAVRAQRFSLAPPGPVELVSIDDSSAFTGQTLASEATGSLSGDLVLDFGLSDQFVQMGAGGVVELEITVNNARFSTVVNSAPDASDDDCDFQISNGGGALGDSVIYRSIGTVNQCSGSSANNATITLPIEVISNGDAVSVDVRFTPTADTGNYAGDEEQIELLNFEPLLSFAVDFDDAAAPPVAQFDAVGDGLQGSGVIARISRSLNGNVLEASIGGGANSVDSAGDVVASADVIISFPAGASGLDAAAVELDGVACLPAVSTAPAAVFTCNVNGAAVEAFDGAAKGLVTITDDGDPASFVTAQTPTVALDLTGDAGFEPDDLAAADVAPIEIDNGLDETAVAGSFPWTSLRVAGGTPSNFRITGIASALGTLAGEGIRVDVSRGLGTAGTSSALISTADLSQSHNGTWTATFSSADLAAALGIDDFARANGDVSFTLVHDESVNHAGAQARRLLTRNGFVTGTGFDQP
ncbi:hypothetical protein [uncultured Maricaulis sp.]|uniref:hypothetical protein n=1 Tax=uncultured Maricaulis sp. TaxID=174710 RepID=UPI002630B9D8|nr:hypothetical protein [uncultured Maricaulis sp.]